MSTTTIIISICCLLLIAYIFDITAGKTKIPSVILLLAMGLLVQESTSFFDIHMPNLNPILPVMGTVGLILIVLEGALELEISSNKKALIGKASLMALLPMLLFTFLGSLALQWIGAPDYKLNFISLTPLAVISSAIAIPTAKNLSKSDNEFVVYESSLSDIFGVVLFNFVALNSVINISTFGKFGIELAIMLIISLVATLGLAFLLKYIKHHVKFIPIILITILIYALCKIYHLPGLIFILLLGLFLGNIKKLKHIAIFNKLEPDELQNTVHKFGELVTEIAFLTRASFFLLFGYLIDLNELINTETLLVALGISVSVYIIRALSLWVFKLKISPLLFLAPRGLITILLFLSILPEQQIPLISKGLVIQVIIINALAMMLGMMFSKKEINQTDTNVANA